MLEHGSGEPEASVGGLDAKVAEDSVRFPAADELDLVGWDVGDEHGCGASRAKTVSLEAVRRDTRLVWDGSTSVAEVPGDSPCCDVSGATPATGIVGVEGRGRGCVVLAQFEDSSRDRSYGVEDRVMVCVMADCFAFHRVLLVSEGQRDETR